MRKRIYLFLVVAMNFLPFSMKGEIHLPAILSDNLVLQSNTMVNLWGNANPAEEIEISLSWSSKNYRTVADGQGRWKIQVKTPSKSNKPEMIKFKGENELTIRNILIGEVWLCSGQSNMDFPVAKATGWRTGVVNEAETMADADYPEIRLFHVVQKLSESKELDDCDGKWEICNKDNLKEFSAVAFFFGRTLYKGIKSPVGLIQSSWGGTPAEAWTKFSVIENDSVYAKLLQEYKNTEARYPQDMKKYESDLANYNVAKEKGDSTMKAPKKPLGNDHNKALSILWNGMIHPLIPYTIRGSVWYQGESNAIRYWDYTKVFSNMISSWRKEWGQGDFPFYFVQIAPQYKQPPGIREAQLNAWKTVKNTGMVVITDVGDSTNIHPRNKQVVGERLADWALAKNYGKKISFSGPAYKSMKIKDYKILLSFDYTDKGLKASNGNLMGFEIAGADKHFYKAEARISGNKIEVSASDVHTPVAVRYGWGNFFRVNLMNGAGLPASPFRTDNWNLESEKQEQ